MSWLQQILGNRWIKLILLLLGIAAALYVLGRLKAVITSLIVSFLLAYLSDPLADLLEERARFPRSLAVAVVIFVILAVLIGSAVVLVPLFAEEAASLGQKIPGYIGKIQSGIVPRVEKLLGFFGVQIPATYEDLLGQATEHKEMLKGLGYRAISPVIQFIHNTFSSLMAAVLGLLNLIIIPVAWFYLLRDIDKIKVRAAEYLPVRHRDRVTGYVRQVNTVIMDFLSGQIVICLILGLLYGLGLHFLAKVPLGFILGILAGLISILPYLGLIVGILPALALAFLEHGDWQHPLLVVVVFAVAQALEGNLITPKIMGEKLGLHPLIVIFSLLVFGEFFGFLGILIAVPATAVIMVFVREAAAGYLRSDFYSAGK